MHPGVDKRSMSYKIAMESFNDIAISLPPEDRYQYRDIAMEAVTGPDTGMVLDKLYKGVNSRSGINFGQIPQSCGDLTSFAKYKTIVETMALLDRDIGDMKVAILKDAHDLHDNLIRLRADFTYGFKTDCQFIKTTYNSMVYALCEILNLCIVVYVDVLKSKVDRKPYKEANYSNLMLVQNVRRFNELVKSGEWSSMIIEIKKAPKKFSGDTAGGLGTVLISLVKDYGAGAGATVAVAGGLAKYAKKNSGMIDALRMDGLSYPKAFFETLKSSFLEVWDKSIPNKVIIVIVGIIAAVMLLRGLVCIFFKATYGLRDILDDQVKLLEANVQSSQNSASATEKQQKMLNMLSGLRDAIETKIIKDDRNGKDEMAKANNDDMRKSTFIPSDDGGSAEPSSVDFG